MKKQGKIPKTEKNQLKYSPFFDTIFSNIMKHALFFCVFSGSLIGLAQANTSVKDCSKIEDAALRLACYDHFYPASSSSNNTSKSLDLAETYRANTQKNETDSKSDIQIVFAQNDDDLHKKPSRLKHLYDLDSNQQGGILSVREHESIYLLPTWYRTNPNYHPFSPSRGQALNDIQQQQKRLETKMQISFKTKLLEDVFKTRADVWFGYTQQSNWQLYNQGEKSAPFRNTDYAPELFITQPVKARLPFNGQLRVLGLGYVHHSNGQSRPLSRSWNRIYAMAGMEWGNLTITPRLWARVDLGGEEDDNPDIMDYMGYGDVSVHYKISDKHTLTSKLRYHPTKHRGAIEVGYTFPIKGKLKAYVQGFYGYGESLLDYNHKQKGLGIGVLLNEWNGI